MLVMREPAKTLFLVGGGVDTVATPGLLNPFMAELERHGRSRGRVPRLVVVLVDQDGSGERFLSSYIEALCGHRVEAEPVFVRRGQSASPTAFSDVDGIAIGGGPTPVYLAALEPAREAIRAAVSHGVPYVGFSAGAMVASRMALIGGWRQGDREVCPEEWSEGLEHLALRPGLDLVPFTVDVHTAQAGLLGRAVSLVESGDAARVVALDEDTCLAVTRSDSAPDPSAVSGSGSVWSLVATGEPGSVAVTRLFAAPATSRGS
jgi:cyanophycinase